MSFDSHDIDAAWSTGRGSRQGRKSAPVGKPTGAFSWRDRSRSGAWVRLASVATIIAVAAGCSARTSATRQPEVAVRVTEDGFVPAQSFAPRGTPITLVVTRVTDQTCATQMVVDGIDRKWDLPLNRRVAIDLPQGVKDTLHFACGMDMYHGELIAK